jgi:hypothetical protein
MNSLEQLNGLVNRALRAVNDAAVCSAQMNIAKRESATNHLVRAVEHLTNVKALIVEADPKLEYHFDAGRPATPYMEAVARLVIEAEAARQSGNTERAEELLKSALKLDPPPFAYESIEKKIAALRAATA